MKGSTATGKPIRRMPLALGIAFGVLLALTSDPAVAQTTFTVNKSGDAADRDLTDSKCDSKRKNGKQCTLRAAIEEANDTAGEDTIEFDIGNTNSVKTISPDSGLPEITDTVTIDGYTQRGAKENTLARGTDTVLKVELDGSGAGFTSGLNIEASDSTVKGLVINRFEVSGISVDGVGNDGNRVEGNFIGTNASGTADRGNSSSGVSFGDQSAGNTVGGTEPAQRNLISGNGNSGVGAAGTPTRNEVLGNYIGTTADGTGDLGNGGSGVRFFGSDNTVGGTQPGAANTIAFNDGGGVLINGSDATGNRILSNSIFQNSGLGIELLGGTEDPNGVTANDSDDPDTGENNLQNFPVLTSATRDSSAGTMTIGGTLNSNPNQTFAIQCFLTGGGDASGHGEGSFLLDTAAVSDNDGDGDVTFNCTNSQPIIGELDDPIVVSATATNTATGDTSEFSENVTVTTVP